MDPFLITANITLTNVTATNHQTLLFITNTATFSSFILKTIMLLSILNTFYRWRNWVSKKGIIFGQSHTAKHFPIQALFQNQYNFITYYAGLETDRPAFISLFKHLLHLRVDGYNEHPGLISFRMDWLDLLAVQGTRKSLLQHHSSKASILWHSAFFTVPLSHPYMTTGKTRALTKWTFVSKVMCLLFNMLSRLVIGEGNGTPLQHSCLENPMNRGD